jgi:hypothetical protein
MGWDRIIEIRRHMPVMVSGIAGDTAVDLRIIPPQRQQHVAVEARRTGCGWAREFFHETHGFLGDTNLGFMEFNPGSME